MAFILEDFPSSFETERLFIRSPTPGDGEELFAAIKESLDELEPWMPWVHHHETVRDSEESARRGWVEFLERKDLRMHLFLRGTKTLVGSSGLHPIEWDIPRFEIGYWLRTGHRTRIHDRSRPRHSRLRRTRRASAWPSGAASGSKASFEATRKVRAASFETPSHIRCSRTRKTASAKN